MIRVGVLGWRGRLGSVICAAVEAADDLELVAQVGRGDALESLVDAGVDVAVDVTTPEAVMANLEFLVSHGIHAVVGTTGFDDERYRTVRGWLADAPGVGVVIASNFSIGAVLMMRFAALAAPYFESAEIVELHHPNKVDAPSGTAHRTAELMAAAREAAGRSVSPDATTAALDGARGAVVEGIHVHSLRIRGLVAHQEVVLGGLGETLAIRHDSLDRASFGPGALAAIRAVSERAGLTVGLELVLPLA